jgi:hypothetical protein
MVQCTRTEGDRGQAVLSLLVWIVVVVVIVAGLGTVAQAAADDARASTAADAAALAAAAAGDGEAEVAARRNGAVVVRIQRADDEVQVWVRVGRAEAVARARRALAPN